MITISNMSARNRDQMELIEALGYVNDAQVTEQLKVANLLKLYDIWLARNDLEKAEAYLNQATEIMENPTQVGGIF